MKHTKTLSYTPSPYSKNSPSLKLKLDFKKNIVNDETPTANKQNQDISIKLQLPQNAQYIIDKKSNPLTFKRKIDHTTNFYQLSKVLDKDQQSYIKMHKPKEIELKKSVKQSSTSRPQQEKLKERLPMNQQVLDKNKKLEDGKISINLSNQVTSRKTVRVGSAIQNENVEGSGNKANDSNMISTKRFKGTVIDLAQFKPNKAKVTPSHSKNSSISVIKKTPKPASSKGTRQINAFRPTPDNLSFQESFADYSKTPDHRKFEREKSSNGKSNLNEVLASKLQLALKGVQNVPQTASRHRRGLSSGQAPIFIEQHQHIVQHVPEKVKPIEFVPVDPQQEQEEFFEHFFHSEQMTFEFERMMILQRTKSQNVSASATPTHSHNKQAMHVRTRSIEDPNSILPTKASSRWNTKRSSVGDENQVTRKETSSLIEQVSDLDKTDCEKEERRKHLRG